MTAIAKFSPNFLPRGVTRVRVAKKAKSNHLHLLVHQVNKPDWVAVQQRAAIVRYANESLALEGLSVTHAQSNADMERYIQGEMSLQDAYERELNRIKTQYSL